MTEVSPTPGKLPTDASRKPIRVRQAASSLWRLFSQVWNNPIMRKEIRGRMRGSRAAVVLTAHLLVLSCFASLIYFGVTQSTQSVGNPAAGQQVGQTLFYSSYVLLLTLVVFLSPAFTAGTLSGERERRTLDILITTLLPTHSLVIGKLISALAYIVLLILAALPIQSLGLVFGGIVVPEVLIGTLILLVTALLAGSTGLFVSSMMRSSIASTVLTYAAILLPSLGLPVALLFTFSLFGVLLDTILSDVSWIWQAVLLYAGGFLVCTNPFATVIATKLVEDEENSLLFFAAQVSDSSGVSHSLPLVSPWIVYIALSAVISLLLILGSILILRHRRG